MQIKIPILVQYLKSFLSNKHLTNNDIEVIIDHYLIAEMTGKKTHGVKKLIWDSKFFNEVSNNQFKKLKSGKNSILIYQNPH